MSRRGRVEVLDGDGELVRAGSETTATWSPWPGGIISGSGMYSWRVVVHDPSVGTVASELAAFELVLSASPP